MPVRITRALNIAIPVETAAYGEVHVHAMPISRAVFERYFLVMGRAFTMVFQIGGAASGPTVAALALREAARQIGQLDGPDGVENGLFAEMHRLTNVAVSTPQGWRTMQLLDARKSGPDGGGPVLDDDDFAEVEGAISFFTLASRMQRGEVLTTTLDGMLSLWGAQTTSSNVTEYANSLPTPNADASSGATASTSSVVF